MLEDSGNQSEKFLRDWRLQRRGNDGGMRTIEAERERIEG